MLCKKCKKELPDDSLFCHYCGSPVQNYESLEQGYMESKNDSVFKEAVKKETQKMKQKSKRNFSWLWIVLIVVNCMAAVLGITFGTDGILSYVFYRMVAVWRYLNIDPKYAAAHSGDFSFYDKYIVFGAINLVIFVLLFIVLTVINSYICKKKINIQQKKYVNLPWLCVILVSIVLSGSLVIVHYFEYQDDIAYYQRQVEKEQREIEKALAEEKAKKEIQKQATALLNSTQKAMSPSELWEYGLRYPEQALGKMVKIEGYVNPYNSFFFLEEKYSSKLGSGIMNQKIVSFLYGNSNNNKPRLLEDDHVIVVGKIILVEDEATSGAYSERIRLLHYGTTKQFVQIEIYDWTIID